ncbi:MAG: DoxX family membrane protein [Bacteroidetes bacterium]|nr:DoxX family membrane protein [Bacteroidota bacterium]
MNWILKNLDQTFLLRFALAVIMIMHGLPSFIDMSVMDFGNWLEEYFGILGVPMAIAIKATHVVTVLALLMNRYLKLFASLNILIFVAGIIMIHGAEGWYVVGGGRNGVEFNFLLIFSFATFLFPKGLLISTK